MKRSSMTHAGTPLAPSSEAAWVWSAIRCAYSGFQGGLDLRGVEADGRALSDQDLLVSDVASARPVGVEQPRVELIEDAAVACVLAQHQRAVGIRDLLDLGRERQSRFGEHRAQAVDDVRAVMLVSRDPLRWVLGVKIKWTRLDLGAVPALKPRRTLQRDIAERSYVVAPDDYPRGIFGRLWHHTER
jgi:hypothetical protein